MQILTKRGPTSNFVYEANIKVMMPKTILISQICVTMNVKLYPDSKFKTSNFVGSELLPLLRAGIRP